MIVSQFTLGNYPYNGFATHHRLLLTNLSAEKGYYFRITLHSRNHQLPAKAAYSVERHNSFMLDLFQPAGQNRYSGRYTFLVPPRETARIQLRPFDVAAWQTPQDSMEAIGHLELTIPLMASFAGSMKPQGDEPVDVLLHAFQVDWVQGKGHRDPGAVAISTGKAGNQIMPVQGWTLGEIAAGGLDAIKSAVAGSDFGERAAVMENRPDIQSFVEDPGSLGAVMTYLASIGENAENVDAFNALLREAGHDLKLKIRE